MPSTASGQSIAIENKLKKKKTFSSRNLFLLHEIQNRMTKTKLRINKSINNEMTTYSVRQRQISVLFSFRQHKSHDMTNLHIVSLSSNIKQQQKRYRIFANLRTSPYKQFPYRTVDTHAYCRANEIRENCDFKLIFPLFVLLHTDVSEHWVPMNDEWKSSVLQTNRRAE